MKGCVHYEQMISAANRLKVVVPVALLLIFILLFVTFQTARDALLVFSDCRETP